MPINACWLHSARVAPLTKLKELTVNTRRPPFKVPLEASIVCVALLATLMARRALLISGDWPTGGIRLLSVPSKCSATNDGPCDRGVTELLLAGPRQRSERSERTINGRPASLSL